MEHLLGGRKYIGPFDRMCAYEEVYDASLTYETYPESKRELAYRVLTKRELPENRRVIDFYFLRVFLSLLFLTGYLFFLLKIVKYIWFYALILILIDALVFILGGATLTMYFTEVDDSEDVDPLEKMLSIFFWLPTTYTNLAKKVFLAEEVSGTPWFDWLKQNLFFLFYSTVLFSRFGTFAIVIVVFLSGAFFGTSLLMEMLLFLLLFPAIVGFLLSLFLSPREFAKALKDLLNLLKGITHGISYYLVIFPFNVLISPFRDGLYSHEILFEQIWDGQKPANAHPISYYQYSWFILIPAGLILSRIKLHVYQLIYIFLVKLYVVFLPTSIFGVLPTSIADPISTLFVNAGDLLISDIIVKTLGPVLVIVIILRILFAIHGWLYYRVIKYARPPEDILEMKTELIEYEKKHPRVAPEAKRKRFFARSDIASLLSRLNPFSRRKKEEVRCEICKQPLVQGVTCPHCDSGFHEDHLLKYLESFPGNRCPVCRRSLRSQ